MQDSEKRPPPPSSARRFGARAVNRRPPKLVKKRLLTCSLAMISTRSFCQTPTHLRMGFSAVKGAERG